MMTPTWTLGDRLRKARDVAGLTQAEMADALVARGFRASRQAITNWETDAAQPRRMMDIIDAWAAITEVDVAWLLTGATVKIAGVRPTLLAAA